MRWQTLANLALSKLFEPPCAACGATLACPLDGAVCHMCWAGIHKITPPVCDRCGDPLPSRLASEHGDRRCRECHSAAAQTVDRARAIGAYEGRLREIIHALKYDGRRSIAPRLSSMMREAGADLLDGADCIVPVPLHPARERARGFNQAVDLAGALGLPVVQLLKRTRATLPQVDLPASRRAHNVRDAFALAGLPPLLVAGSRFPAAVVLVDDVSTTGATLEQCAMVLKTAGVKSVRALTAARVASGRP